MRASAASPRSPSCSRPKAAGEPGAGPGATRSEGDTAEANRQHRRGVDTKGRRLARRIGASNPGTPKVVPQHMRSAGSQAAAAHVSGAAAHVGAPFDITLGFAEGSCDGSASHRRVQGHRPWPVSARPRRPSRQPKRRAGACMPEAPVAMRRLPTLAGGEGRLYRATMSTAEVPPIPTVRSTSAWGQQRTSEINLIRVLVAEASLVSGSQRRAPCR